jgi:hypothetical protein
MAPSGDHVTTTPKFIVTVLSVSIVLLWAPRLATPEAAVWLHLCVAVFGLCAFVYLGFQVVEKRESVVAALVLFLSGLLLELCSFAFLYQSEGVLCAITTPNGRGAIQMIYEVRTDFKSCLLLSIDVWTAGGYGSLMARHSQGGWAAAEMLIGYLFMAVFIAILINVFQQSVHHERREWRTGGTLPG